MAADVNGANHFGVFEDVICADSKRHAEDKILDLS